MRKSSLSPSFSTTNSFFVPPPSTTPTSSTFRPTSIHSGPLLYHHCRLSPPQSRVPNLQNQIPPHAFPRRGRHNGARQNLRVTNIVTIRFFLKASPITKKSLIEGNNNDNDYGAAPRRHVPLEATVL